MAVKKDFAIIAKGDSYINSYQDTLDEAISTASDYAASNDAEYVIYEAVRAIKPERAPVTVTTL